MTSTGEQAERQAFVQASIDAAHAFMTNEKARSYLAYDFTEGDLAYHEQLTNRMFAAEVVDGAIRIPEERQTAGDIPVVAVAPDETLVLSPDFARLSPIMQENMSAKLGEWGATLPHAAYIGLCEAWAGRMLTNNPVSFSRPFGSGDAEHGVVRAAVLSSTLPTPFWPEVLPLTDDWVKHVALRPALGIRYEGPNTPLPSVPTMMHEQEHIHQQETAPLRDVLPTQKDKEYRFRMELGAYHFGARAVDAHVLAGYPWKNLDEIDHFQRSVNADRESYNQTYSDPFTPSARLMRKYGKALLKDTF